MPISMKCPSCAEALNFSDALVGKTVKCKACGEPVTVKAAKSAPAKAAAAKAVSARKAVDEDEDDEPIRPKRKSRADDDDEDDDRPRSKKSRRRDEDDEDDDEPAKKSMMMPILLGVLALVLVVGGVVFAMGMGKDKSEVAGNGGGGGGGGRTITPPPSTKTEETPPTQPTTEPTRPQKYQEPDPETTNKDNPITPGTKTEAKFVKTRPTKDKPDEETFTRIKAASVYFEVEDWKGSGASGSGWFGLEDNLIFTNAHVVGMLSPGSKEPRKITAFLNSGRPNQRIIPHAHLKILAVDRDMDLSILEVIAEKDLPKPLQVRLSQGLGDLENLFPVGYPGGRRLSQNTRSGNPPLVTVSETKVQQLPLDSGGNIYTVQIQGGIHHGSSGGAICDADGNVACVAVRGDIERQQDGSGFQTGICYGVPTEYCLGLLAGRVSNVEYGQPYYKDGKSGPVVLPVSVRTVDPRKRLKEVGIAAWIGDNEDKAYRSPGLEHIAKPSDTGFIETKLAYDAEKRVATGELVFDAPESGRAIWVQPYYGNSITPKHYMGGERFKMTGSPLERAPAELATRFKMGSKRQLTITYGRSLEESEEGEGSDKDDRQIQKFLFTLNETVVKSPDANYSYALQSIYKSMEIKVNIGAESHTYPKSEYKDIQTELQKTMLVMKGKRTGELEQVSITPIAGAQFNQSYQPIVLILNSRAVEGLRHGTIPLPGKTMQAMDTWVAKAPISVKVQSVKETRGPNGQPVRTVTTKEVKANEELTFTYLGSRDHSGKKELVIQVDGVVKGATGAKPDSASGTVKGLVVLEAGTGVMIESDLKHEYDIDNSEKGVKKSINGIEEVRITRGPETN